jgi:hypothetical protein
MRVFRARFPVAYMTWRNLNRELLKEIDDAGSILL